MSDTTSHNPNKNPSYNSSIHNENNYELITSYIDNQINEEDKIKIKYLIDSDNDFYNRYVFEKLTKDTFQKHNKRIETPLYIYKNIGRGIDDYIKSASKSKINSTEQSNSAFSYTQRLNPSKRNLRKYLIYSSFAFVVLIALAFLLNNYLKNNPGLNDNDFVSVSRKAFDKITSGDEKIQYQSNNAKELSDTMNKYLDFKTFIPDVKDATLIGGVCSEINGEKIAHIVHKKGNIIIYTLQASLKDIMDDDEQIVLSDQHKDSLQKGKNWFPCLKDKKKTAVIWFRDNVICSTVAEMEPQEIFVVLTNYK